MTINEINVSISEMSKEGVMDLIQNIRASRRTRKRRPVKATKRATPTPTPKLTKSQAIRLLKELEQMGGVNETTTS